MPASRRPAAWRAAVVLAAAFALSAAAAPAAGAAPPTLRAKNVILMIGDGAGYHTWEIAERYEGTWGSAFHDGPGWIRVAASTHALRQWRSLADSAADPLAQDPTLVYDPAKAWSTGPPDTTKPWARTSFAGYQWLLRAPDSANTATTLSTGIKTYCGAINVDGAGTPIRDTLARLAKDSGRRVGVVTTVPFPHATPAALGGAHSTDRGTYATIAREMLTSDVLDVIGGAANPDYDHIGRPIEDPHDRVYRYVGGPAAWARLGGRPPGKANLAADDPLDAQQRAVLDEWTLVQAREDIEALAWGDTPSRLLMVPRVGQIGLWTGAVKDSTDSLAVVSGTTLQQERGSQADPRYTEPGYDPMTPDVPSLAEMTRAALNALDDDPDGFYLMVEGGAIDWAMHANQLGRMIEEVEDFQGAIHEVLRWVDANGGWDETILVITADHDHLLWGPDADKVPFDPIRDGGPGRLPGYRWLGTTHSAALVPVFARGVGAEALAALATRKDPRRGAYLDQADIHAVLRGLLRAER